MYNKNLVFYKIIIIVLIIYLILKKKSTFSNLESNHKTLILYCYYEDSKTKENLEYFVKHGLINSDKYQYKFIINNYNYTVPIPKWNTIEIIQRKESIDDLQTYKQVIAYLRNKNFNFDTFNSIYFINSSCIGPFLPTIVSENWIDLFNKKLNNCDLIAPILELPPIDFLISKKEYINKNNLQKYINNLDINKNIPFLHTYMFGVSNTGFKLIDDLLKSIPLNTSKDNVILFERLITCTFLNSGKKISDLLLLFKNIDMNEKSNYNYNKYVYNNKSCYEIPNNYFGIDINPLEVIFVKNIRNINETRGTDNSGISENLHLILSNYKKWY